MKTNGGFLISQIKQIQGRVFERMLAEEGISFFNGAQGKILYVLWEKGTLTISQISKLTSLAKTTLTGMLDRMEAAGLIHRIPDRRNRRQIHIEITPKAREYRAEYDRVSERMNQIFYEGFGEGEITEFEEKLKRIIGNLEREEQKHG